MNRLRILKKRIQRFNELNPEEIVSIFKFGKEHRVVACKIQNVYFNGILEYQEECYLTSGKLSKREAIQEAARFANPEKRLSLKVWNY